MLEGGLLGHWKPSASAYGRLKRTMTEEELVSNAGDGDTRAWQKLCSRYAKPLTSFVKRRVGNGAQPDDIVQEAFERAFRSITSGAFTYRGKGRLRAFLYKIAANEAARALRAAARRPSTLETEPLDDSAEDPPTAVLRQEEHERLTSYIMRLPQKQCCALVLRDLYGKCYKDIAELMDVSLGTAHSLVKKAEERLRAKMRGED